jgi:monoamine oxidase
MLPLTRRTFIERLGLTGGSALVMSAMRSWDLMAAQAGPRPILPVLSGRPSGTKVIVLGAGVSGMTVAYELRKLGYSVSILEARDRVGGVNWTIRRGTTHTELGSGEKQVCDFDEGLYLNGGPWRLPHWHTGVLGYCKELGVPLEIFINEAEASYFYYEGDNIGPLANTRVRAPRTRRSSSPSSSPRATSIRRTTPTRRSAPAVPATRMTSARCSSQASVTVFDR